MNVIKKIDIEKTIKFLQTAVEEEENYQLRSSLANMICVLKQALKKHHEDSQHPHLYLEIVKAPNQLDSAIAICCTTDCTYYREGNCPYSSNNKYQCSDIKITLMSDNEKKPDNW